MEHPLLDQYASLSSPIHRLDPRAKVFSAFFLLVIIVSLRSLTLLLATSTGIFLLLLTAKLPVRYILAKLAWVIPFGGAMALTLPFLEPGPTLFTLPLGPWTLSASHNGMTHAGVLSLRIVNSLMVVAAVTSTTRFNTLLKALQSLGIPAVFINLLEFTVRYVFLFIDEFQRMEQALKARGFGHTLPASRRIKTLGELTGMLFIRSYERAERIYLAMMARNYSGQPGSFYTFRAGWSDYWWIGAAITCGLVLAFLDHGLGVKL